MCVSFRVSCVCVRNTQQCHRGPPLLTHTETKEGPSLSILGNVQAIGQLIWHKVKSVIILVFCPL